MRRDWRDHAFTIDLRSLALFRLLFAALLICDWFGRWGNLEAFYTAFGVLPIEAPLPKAGGDFHFSLLDGLTSLPLVRLFFLAGLVAYLGLLVGYRTKLASILSFVFLVSVLNRNILIRHGGDVVLVTMLAWALFLPLGRRFSLDAVTAALRRGVDLERQPDENQSSPRSFAAFALVAQIALIYLMSAFAKWGREWVEGTALWYTLQIDLVVTPLGRWVATWPQSLLRWLTWGALGVEYAAPVLILSPFPQPWFRRLAIALLTALHLAMALTLALGSFPFVMIATYALLLRPEDWTLIRRLARRWSRPVTVRYDEDCGFCQRVAQLVTLADGAGFVRWIGGAPESSIVVLERDGTKPRTRASAAAAIARALPLPFHPLRVLGWPGLRALGDRVYSWVARNRHRLSALFGLRACRLLPSTERREISVARRGRRVLANVAVATVFGCVTLHSYNNNMTWPARQAAGERLPWLRLERVPEPRWLEAIVQAPQLDHDWKLFAPYPLKDDGWWVIDGVTLSGRRLDPLTGAAPTFDKPPDLIRRYDTAWRKYLYRLWLRDHAGYRPWFDRYITRRQHREDPADRLDRFSLYYVEEWTREPGVPLPWPTRRVRLSEHDCFARDP